MSEVTTYVAGFLFYRGRVLLVQKNRPHWQAGLWNAVGGKVEDEETPEVAMQREFVEETGLHVHPSGWQCFCTEAGRDYTVHFYRATLVDTAADLVVRPQNDVGEKLSLLSLHELVGADAWARVVGNLNWLIPMALDWRGMVAIVAARDDITERPSW